MSTSTIKSADKIKLLEQMLEDLAGDEFDEYDSSETAMHAQLKHDPDTEELDIIDTMH